MTRITDRRRMYFRRGMCSRLWGPHRNPHNPTEGVYTRMINKARDYIYITTPYLVLDQSMRDDLTSAAQSGVDVYYCAEDL